MLLTTQEIRLLAQATNNLGKDYQPVISGLLISICKSHDWFHEYLFYALKKGVTFNSDTIDSLAKFDYDTNTIIFHSSFLPKYLFNLPRAIIEYEKLVLRHLVTQAFDILQLNASPTEEVIALKRLVDSRNIANKIYNALTCVDTYHKVNRIQLTNIADALNLTSADIGSYPTYDGSSSVMKAQTAQIIISAIGFSRETGMEYIKKENIQKYITDLWHLEKTNFTIYLATNDHKRIRSLFKKTRPFREKNNLTFLEKEELVQQVVNNPNLRNLWKNLSGPQRAALDTLYTLRDRFQVSVIPDDDCFPKMNECLTQEQQNCFKAYFKCQTDATNIFSSLVKTHAALQERVEGYLLTEEMLDNLCSPPHILSQPAKIPAQITQEKTLSNQPEQVKQATTSFSVLQTGVNCFGYTLADEMAQSYFEAKEYKNIALWKSLVNIGYILFCYSLLNLISGKDKDAVADAWQISLSIAFTLLKSGIEFLSENNASPQMGIWQKRIFSAGIFAAQTYSEGPGSVLINLTSGTIGSSIGSLCANSMSQKLGWQTTHKVFITRIENILSHSNKPLEYYQPFINAVKEKNYSKALRVASNSTDPIALSLVQLLLEHKEKLAININEPAGTENRAALHYAAIRNNKVIYYLLLQNGAIDAEDNLDTTAEQYLKAREEPEKKPAYTV